MVGLEISDQSLKFLELLKDDSGYHLGRFGEVALPAGTVEQGVLRDWKSLYQILTKIKDWSGFDDVQVALPNSLLDWSKETIHGLDDYKKVFSSSGLNPRSFELSGQALARVLNLKPVARKKIFLHLDDLFSSAGFVENGELVDLLVWPLGGELFDYHLKKNLNLGLAEARRLKMSQGLSRARGNDQIFKALLPAVSVLCDEIGKQMKVWPEVDCLVLSGQQALIPGLVEYLRSYFDHTIVLANPWENIFSNKQNPSDLTFSESLRFAPTIGASLAEFV